MRTRRAATVIATTPATTPTIRIASTTSESTGKAPVVTKLNDWKIDGHMRSTIEKKMISDAPLPRPRSVICSPSHMTKIAPVVRNSIICTVNHGPGRETAAGSDEVNRANPYAWISASTTVR